MTNDEILNNEGNPNDEIPMTKEIVMTNDSTSQFSRSRSRETLGTY